MSPIVLALSMVVLLSPSVFAYINAGFKSQAEYHRHLRQQRAAQLGRATEGIRRNPRDAVAYLYRGNIYAERSTPGAPHGGPNYEEALADYDRAIELDPQLAEAYFQRGQARWWRQLRELASATERQLEAAQVMADVEKATRLKPGLVKAQVFLAMNTKDLDKAIEAMKRACDHTKYKNEVCLQLLASFYARKGDFDNAIHWQEKALQLPIFGIEDARKRLENYRHQKPNEWFFYGTDSVK